MKKILLLLILLLYIGASQTKAQGYYKFLNNSSWCEAVNSGFGIPIDYFLYNQSNDTVINTKTYAKIFSTGNNSTFFVREDTIAKKVYIKSNATASEVILYDFSLNVGDTLYAQYGWGAGYKLIVRTIDTVTILAGQRREFYLSDTSGNVFYTAIESVGSVNDPFLNNGYPPGDPQYNLVCSYQNYTQVYDAGLYGYACYSYSNTPTPCNANFTYTVGLNGQVTFQDSTPGIASHHWTFGYGGTIDTTVLNSPSVTISFPCNGNFTVACTVTSNSNTCYSNYNNSFVSIFNAPNSLHASFTYTIGVSGQINCTNTSTGIGGGSNINSIWYVYDSTHTLVNSSNLDSPYFPLTPNQYYIIELEDYSYPCYSYDTDTIYIPDITALRQIVNQNEQVNIYPNPVSTLIQIGTKEIEEVSLYDLLGNEILTTKENEIDVSSLTNGVYFIQVNTKENNYTQKVIVQH